MPKKNTSGNDDPGSLTYRTFDEEFPQCSNCLSLVIGGTGSGKSYFTYNYLLPTYIEFFDVKWIIICSKTAGCDKTLQEALDKCGAKVIIDPQISSLFATAQQIRAQALKTEFIKILIESKDPQETMKNVLKKRVVKMKTYPVLQNELKDIISKLEPIIEPGNYNIIRRNIELEMHDHQEKWDRTYIREEPKKLKLGKYDPDEEAKKYPVKEPSHGEGSQSNPNSSTDEDEAAVQIVTLENPVMTKIAKDDKYDEDESDPEKTTIELSYGVVVRGKRKISETLSDKLIMERIKHNLRNLLIASEEIYGEEYQPILLIVDDNAVSSELSNQNSNFTQLCLTRRHLHCNVVILVQGVTYINTSIRRNATSMHLLPTMSDEDLKLIEKRLPRGLINTELAERYLQNVQRGERNQQMTHIFMSSNPSKIIDGMPDSIAQYKL